MGGDHFDVHRFHPPLIYGRRGDHEEGEGICLIKGKDQDEQEAYMIICYALPIVSARAIPMALEFYSSTGSPNKSVTSIKFRNNVSQLTICFSA